MELLELNSDFKIQTEILISVCVEGRQTAVSVQTDYIQRNVVENASVVDNMIASTRRMNGRDGIGLDAKAKKSTSGNSVLIREMR